MTGADRRLKDIRPAPRRGADGGARRMGGPPPTRGRGRPFRPLRWAWLLLLVALLAPAYDLFLPAGWRPIAERRTVVIDRGESLHDIAHELQRVGVIRGQAGFLVLARIMQLDRSVKAGQYSFRVGITVPALLRALDRGMFGLNLITIPEGLMVNETASLIQRQVGIRATAIDSLARDRSLLDSLGVNAPSLEGWLAPDSYEWLPGTSPEVVLRTMVARTRDRVQRATAGYDSLPLGMNAHEVLTLASIVESESKAQDERPRIARVYLNRLDRGMLLQADPTVGYALGRGPRSRLTFKDLRVESSYNTYRHEGLPPGPICSPGLSAIEAVMHATLGTKDLYFVANGQGRHIFAPTYAQHLANIAFVRGRKAAAEAAATRDASGSAEPDSDVVGGAPAHAASVASAVRSSPAPSGASRATLRQVPPPAGASVHQTATGVPAADANASAVLPRPASAGSAPVAPTRLAPAGVVGDPRPHTTSTSAMGQETPPASSGGTPLKGMVTPAPGLQPAATTPSADAPVRPVGVHITRAAADSGGRLSSLPRRTHPAADSAARAAARAAARRARAATDSTARQTIKPAGPKLSTAARSSRTATTSADSSLRKVAAAADTAARKLATATARKTAKPAPTPPDSGASH